MTIGQDLGPRLLPNIAPIARKLEREDRAAFLDLICEYQAAAPEERGAFSDRFEPYLDLLQASGPSDSGACRPLIRDDASRRDPRRYHS